MLTGKPLFPGKDVVHQLYLTTDLLGTPPPETIAKVTRYLGNKHKKPPVLVAQKFPHADPLTLRLLEPMLAFDPKDRPSTEGFPPVVKKYDVSLEGIDNSFQNGSNLKMCIAFLLNSSHFSLFVTTTHVQGVSITQENSLLDNTARIESLLARFPMFDWVGGRTSGMSAVGLILAALQDMVVLPYKDSLLLFSSYIQQLREGVHYFFATFIEVLRDRPPGHDWELEPGGTFGDYHFGMLQGTRSALYSNDRESITVTVQENAGN
ncbi:hypothetical protein KY290_001058 [Solanum tuberosum]|uniref:Protein kinase domain-containing protein n=1 Tax=Solanum tuberosum TaxID=4113 RepID=A0ABQ7WLP6_SOLTU|nr:hypothetical protein KY290_001058 [Solanum tuberosum]